MKILHTLPHAKPTSRILAEQAEARRSAARLDALFARIDASLPDPVAAADKIVIEPITGRESHNPLRPHTLEEMVGQERLKPLLRRIISTSRAQNKPVPHLLMVGAAGTGKTTLATVIGNEIGTRVFALKAPVDMGVLNALRETCRDGDVVFVDELHQQVAGDRRGITQACDPEAFYLLLEDGVLATALGPLSFPRVTWIGATTDAGLLPVPLLDRFPLQPQLDPYTEDEMTVLAQRNADALGLRATASASRMFARASRGIPRQVNTYVKQAQALGAVSISDPEAREVVVDLSSTTLDGLTRPMQNMLKVLLAAPDHRASVNTIATQIGFSRDTKHVALNVERDLIRLGYVAVTARGRMLTDEGIARAQAL